MYCCGLWEPNLDQCTFLYKKKISILWHDKKIDTWPIMEKLCRKHFNHFLTA